MCMSTKQDIQPRLRLPNKNDRGMIHFNLDVSSSACVVDGVPSHRPFITLQMQRDKTKLYFDLPRAQTIPFEKPVAKGLSVAETNPAHPTPWFKTRRGAALVAGVAVTLVSVVALAVAIASSQCMTSASPPSPPYQISPLVLSLPSSSTGPLTVSSGFVFFDVVGVPVKRALVSVDGLNFQYFGKEAMDILKQAVVGLLPHFIKEGDITTTRNITNPTTVHTSVNCGIQSNSALIVQNVVSQPSCVQGLAQETGFSGMLIANVLIYKVEALVDPPAPPSPNLPPSSPPYHPSSPPRPPDVPASDETRCFDLKAGRRWQGPVIGVDSGLVNTVLERCSQQASCKVVSRLSSMDPWLLSTRQGFLFNESGATTYMYRDGCETSPPSQP